MSFLITKTAVEAESDGWKVLDLLSHCYEPGALPPQDSLEFLELPQTVRDALAILDFETSLEMEGLGDWLTLERLHEVQAAFHRTGNMELAKICALLRPETSDNASVWNEQLGCEDGLRSLIEAKDFWVKVAATLGA